MPANEVRINVVADTRQAETSLKRVGQKFEGVTPGVNKMQSAFAGLTKSMALFGIGSIGASVVLGGLTRAAGAASKAQANLALIVGRLPPELKTAFDKAAPEFDRLSKEFAIPVDDIAVAFADMIESTRQPLDIGPLEAALGRTALGAGDLGSNVDLAVKALLGGPAAIEAFTGNLEGLEQGFQRTADRGRDAITPIDQFRVSLQNITRAAGGAVNAILAFDPAVTSAKGALKELNEFKLSDLRNEFLNLFGIVQSVKGIIDLIRGGGSAAPTSAATPRPGGAPGGFELGGVPQAVPGFRAPVGAIRPRSPGGGGAFFPAFRNPGVPIGEGGGRADLGSFITPLQGFKHGGTVPGPVGSAVPIIAHGGETVIPSGGGGFGSITFQIQGDVVIDDENRMNKLVREIERLLTQRGRTGLGI